MPATSLTITSEFSDALKLLDQGQSVFLTGKAGTGKSTLIRYFLERTDRRAITVAPTGIAALNVDGYTIHRLFSFPTGVDEHLVRSGSYRPTRFAKAIQSLDILIVDEVSMVRADLFDAMVAALELFGPHPGERFGGVQLVLVGDLFQLPPVVRDSELSHFELRYKTPFFFSADSFDRATFPTVELTTVFRQIGDSRMVELLNSVREGSLLQNARAELNRHTDPAFEPDVNDFWLTLATTNRIVGARNRAMLERLPLPPVHFHATCHGDLDGFDVPTESDLAIAVGAQIMLLNNDSGDRWVNGSIGRVEAIAQEEDEPVVTVLLRDGGRVNVERHTWEITRPRVDGGRLAHDVVGSFRQLPMKLAWAITIHKSQGQTLDRVIVDLTGGTFANGQLYVALSRCTNLNGLVLKRDVLPRDLKTDIRVRRFLNTSNAPTQALGNVYIAALTVGNEGDRYRPRPVEIAVVTDDDEATTVVNPTSDLYQAEQAYGITTRDTQLAPVLSEAWAALSPLLAGRVPAGVGIDTTLSIIDSELKRNGIVEMTPLGREIPIEAVNSAERKGLESGRALDRARAMRATGMRVFGQEAGGGTTFPTQPRGRGFVLARTTGVDGVKGPDGFTVGGNLGADDDPAQELATLLKGAWERVVDRDREVVERIHTVEQRYGVSILPEDFHLAESAELSAILIPGARLCFTGTAVVAGRGVVDRTDLQRIAVDRGLALSENMTKTRTDVLVVAARGTQSRKAKNAAQWKKPVITVDEFLRWAGELAGSEKVA